MGRFRLTDRVPFDLCNLFYGTVSEHRSQDAAGDT
jgi:hypothetical protein